MKRESSQLPSQPIANPRNNPLSLQPNVLSKNPQFENAKAINELRSGRILRDPYEDQERKTSTDKNLEEEINIETNHIKEPETSNDPNPKLSKKDKRKEKAKELPKTYKPRAPFPSALEAGPSHKKQETCNEELLELFKQVHINLSLLDAI